MSRKKSDATGKIMFKNSAESVWRGGELRHTSGFMQVSTIAGFGCGARGELRTACKAKKRMLA